ncbi:ATP-binding cassette domain-containing protein [Streptomyces sp. WMMB 322]|uniref:ATP-binding cassette domain-containing protein n=1 Tax=Streptomyces sp. WMMB 322 TaxID=1286821 RepID=UPI000823C052|nr:ATP-binding cassette domain-containing protein [Streptomyces sp. WMMB 322]SCK42242.1 monosaccharide ABC transporter ATP-binding protein, CUT2 family (TC 3.A.1.2.-) [Streptomyces sp. WMMB 322]
MTADKKPDKRSDKKSDTSAEKDTEQHTGSDAAKDTETGAGAAVDAGSPPRDAATAKAPLVELTDVSKFYGNIRALEEVSLQVQAGEITCVLGDNGAGKSTLIKIVAGLHQHDAGTFRINGEETRLSSPREALDRGIATVYQDLAVVPLMPVWRNFFLGSEPAKGRFSKGPFARLDVEHMRRTTHAELLRMGIDLRDVDQPIGTLSGGERQCVAIARAVYFGAKVLVLDEPTAALGVKQSGVVLKYVAAARDAGLGVVLITHNPHHAYLVGDRFVLLKRGAMAGSHHKDGLQLEELTRQMSGGSELEQLSHELERAPVPQHLE